MGVITETNFFGNFKQIDAPKVLIIPAPYEYTTFYCKGTKDGPQAIINASTRLEPFDDELWVNTSEVGINTSNFVNCEFVNNKSRQPFNELQQVVRNSLISGSLPIIVGGEQSLSFGGIKAVYDLYPDVSVLYFGSRSRLKSSYQNNKFSSECTLRQVNVAMPDLKIIQVGVRSVSKEETEYLEGNGPNIEIFFAREKSRWSVADILSNLTKNVYLAFSFDVLDPAIMPSVGIPEVDGLTWEQATNIVKNVCSFKEVVGMDFLEFSPISGLCAPDFLAAKLIYKTIGYSFARQLGVFEEKEPSLTANES